MTLHHFRIFQAVAQQGNMSRAAEALGTAQPPVSQAIAQMERYYGASLFDRLGRGVRLTPAGERLQSSVAHVLRLVDEAESQLREFSEAGDLRVGASMTVGSSLLAPICQHFRGSFPQAQLRLWVENTTHILKRLHDAEIDVAVVEGPVADGNLFIEPICRDDLVLVCGWNHPWAKVPRIRASDLEGASFFVREEGSGTREVFASAMTSRSLNWKLAGEIGGAVAILELVAAGLGLAFVSRRAAVAFLANSRVREIPIDDFTLTREFRLVMHGNKLVTPALLAFSQSAREAGSVTLKR